MPAKRTCDMLVLRVLLEHGPLTAAEIATTGGIARAAVNEGLRHLKPARRVYVSGHLDTFGAGRERPIYAVGNQPDAVFTRKSDSEYRVRYVAGHAEEIRMRDRKRRNGCNNPLMECAP
jgi:predicted ArsR family transcriptional regulator